MTTKSERKRQQRDALQKAKAEHARRVSALMLRMWAPPGDIHKRDRSKRAER